MPKLTVNHDDRATVIPFEGMPVLSFVLKQYGLLHTAPCGGKGICGKCRMQTAGCLSEPEPDERKCLAPTELNHGMRLACQARLTGDASVILPKAAELINIQSDGYLPPFPHSPMQGRFGVAADIGTTTLALKLIDLQNGRVLETVTSANPQGGIAADVIGRIEAALNGEGSRLQKLAAGEMERLMYELCQHCGILMNDIGPMVVTGNTTMLYLLTGKNPAALSRAPFQADCLFGYWTDAGSIGFSKNPEIEIYLPACVSAFVGADITCGVLASQMCTHPETSLLVDLGTNGEIALWHQEKLYCCATAAGPAFEGGNIGSGAGSVPGAIDRVYVEDGMLRHTTLGNRKPVGICGSGLIDAVAGLLQLGLVDETGLMASGEVFISEEISLTQKDIRNLQLAKGAIAAGIKTICRHVGISVQDITTLYIAGGFGSHVDIENAAAIGLIPRELMGKTVVLGNAPLTGAVMLLLQQGFESDTMLSTRRAISIPLGGSGIFAEKYIECMMFEINSNE